LRITILDQDIPLSEEKRLIKRLWKVNKSKKYPNGLEFAYQFLFLKDNEWKQIARIDNQLHDDKPGVHIHVLHRNVKWEEMSFDEAEEKIIELATEAIKLKRW